LESNHLQAQERYGDNTKMGRTELGLNDVNCNKLALLSVLRWTSISGIH
jgi:hypothetical protein